MSKTSVFTSITPLPAGITRQSVLDTYRNHTEMIELNPLVVERFRCKPPNYAPSEEFYSTWYTIKDKVSYLPGGLATGSVSYHACFHDLPDGLQTHVYAPLGLDIRAKWSVGGSLPGEPKAPVELGIGAPREGLYIREDVRMRCNIMMMGFVKKTFKESHAKLVDRLVEKAHILESEAANARLKMLKEVAPGERMGHGSIFIAPPPDYTPIEHQQQEFEDEYFGATHQQQYESHQLPLYQEYHPERHSDTSSHSSPQLQRLYHQSLSSTNSSNPSALSSPHPSYASTHTSNNLLSPAPLNIQKPLPSPPPLSQERRCLHKHTHSADFNARDAMRCDPHPADVTTTESRPRSSTIATAIPAAEQETLDTLPATTYLPPTKYSPATLPATSYLPASSHRRERSRSPGPAPDRGLPPLPAELPGTTYYPAESPILGRQMEFFAELPA